MRLSRTIPADMKARDRKLADWLHRVESGSIALPRFQRYDAWGPGMAAGLLTSVFRGLPAGSALVLEVGDKEKFASRLLRVAVPETPERIVEQLLDGQQRLTALWRAFNEYKETAFLIAFEDDPAEEGARLPTVKAWKRWPRDGRLYPLWTDDPVWCWGDGLIPVPLVKPGADPKEVRGWIAAASGGDPEKARELEDLTDELRERAGNYNLPYLALSSGTPARTALDVYIKVNTNYARLSVYDIVVALVEDQAGVDYREMIEKLKKDVPRAERYGDPIHTALGVTALRQDAVPTPGEFGGLDFRGVVDEWPALVHGVKEAAALLEEESVFDAQRLPTFFVLPVVAALFGLLAGKRTDELGNARIVLKKYLWRSFLTRRYQESAAWNALSDYRELKAVLVDGAPESSPAIFNEDELDGYPLPSKPEVKRAPWPKGATTIGRGLLALQLKCGAEDLADGTPATAATFDFEGRRREYHHLFPASTLAEAGLEHGAIGLALNCALVTAATNRTISAKDPIDYLKERADICSLKDDEIKRRLATHLVPWSKLAVGFGNVEGDARASLIRESYEAFLDARAELLLKAARLACDGRAIAGAIDPDA